MYVFSLHKKRKRLINNFFKTKILFKRYYLLQIEIIKQQQFYHVMFIINHICNLIIKLDNKAVFVM